MPQTQRPAVRTLLTSTWAQLFLPLKVVKPKVVVLDGEQVRLASIGELAELVRRSQTTLRRWEREGVIPPARYRFKSASTAGRRRLYSPEQITVISEAAWRAGVSRCQRGTPV
jgi:MerR HTH family regulatory protein